MLQTVTGFLIHQALCAMTTLLRSSERRCAVGVSIDKPEDDPERHVVIINDQGREIGTEPVYSKPTFEHPAK
jgi:hypothetical protein